MEIQETRDGEVVIVAPHGKLDPQSEAAFDRKLKELLDAQARYLVVDFGKVDYVSGGALRALLLVMRRLRPRDGRLVLCRLSAVVHQAFTIAGFDSVFVMVPTRAEAVEKAGPPRPASPDDTAAQPAVTPEAAAEAPPAATPEAPPDDRIARIAARALPLLAAGGARADAAFSAAARPLPKGLAERVRRLVPSARA